MAETKKSEIKKLHIRAALPRYFRIGAVGVLALTVIAIGIGFYRSLNNAEFRMKGFPTSLSKDVVASVNGYERREVEGDVVKYYIKADKATTFADNHQELENVYLQVFEKGGGRYDEITAQKAVYIPEEDKNFTGYFAGDVNIHTRDDLKVRTEQVTYKKSDETASAEEQVEFERENVRGKSFGALVHVAAKRLELLRDVEIETYDSPDSAASGTRQSLIRAGYASYDQLAEKIDAQSGVEATVNSGGGTADVSAARAAVYLAEVYEGGRDVDKLELFDNVRIASRQGDGKPTNIESGYAVYDKDADRFDLRQGVRIVTVEDDRPTTVTSVAAVYEKRNGRIFVEGNAEITQGNDFIRGDHITAELYPSKKLKSSTVRGNAYLRQNAPDRTTEIFAFELNAAFNENQHLQNANAMNGASAILTPVNPVDYSKVKMTAPRAIRVAFKGEGLLDRMSTEGRTTIQLDVPGGTADAANKQVTADTVSTFFNAAGTDIQKAEAIGDAELYVEPLQAGPQNYKTTVNAPRFDCEFYPTGNNAKNCVAATKARAVRVPTLAATDRGTQTITADRLTASFHPQSKDVERLDASGSAKFTELDRKAVANEFSFTQSDETLRLRGGEPTVWDSKARAKAPEIDWDTRNQKSYLRGGVSTTYYSQKSSGGATPFGETDKPVFVTAESGEFDHRAETGIYTGNARGWQESNYVRADRFFIQQQQGQFNAEGSVQSLLYNAKRRENGRESNVPVYASAGTMTYYRDDRVLHYESNVDIRQGTDRIVGGAANVFLDGRNEVARTDIQNNVVITQPNRRASGDYAEYVTANESVVLRGNPARIEDAESGSSAGGELIVYLRENRVINEGKTKENTSGRTRSVYKVRNN